MLKQALRRTAPDGYGIGADAVVARGGKINALRIPAPAFHIVRSLVPTEALDVSAGDGHDIHIAAAELVGTEGEPLAVGRYAGPGFVAIHSGEAGGKAAGSGYAPNVGIIAKIDGLPVGAESRIFCKINGVVLRLKQAEREQQDSCEAIRFHVGVILGVKCRFLGVFFIQKQWGKINIHFL